MQSKKAVERRGYHKKSQLFHFDNSASFREQILSYNHNIMRTGYCMRYCTRCGVGIRLMFYKVYYFRYYDGPYLCERCKKIVGERKVEPIKRTRVAKGLRDLGKPRYIKGGTGFRINKDGTVRFQTATIVGG
ncbi:MAG: hypothetical protein KAV87_50400 [Desulfobacteraceae bacterium]|nr:hypothetical protein [Desulfobacteraceae bacterium]